MPKIRNMSSKGLVQEPGSGVTFEQGSIKRELITLSATVSTAAATKTALGITPAAGDRCLGYKIEILSTTGGPAGNLTKLGDEDGTDDDRYGTFTITANAVSSTAKAALATARTADLVAKEIGLYHDNPGGGKSSEVRVTVFLERYS